MRRPLVVLPLCLALLTVPATAKPRARSAAVDDQGHARVTLSQRQIFEEIGGRAQIGVDLGSGLGVIDTGLTLPEEAGDVTGTGFLDVSDQSLSLISDFLYKPVKRKQVKVDIDYRSVGNEESATGQHSIAIDYPMALEKIPAATRDYLSKSSYKIKGKATWSKYTDGTGQISIEIRDPDFKKTPPALRNMTLVLWDADQVTNFQFHFEVAADSKMAQFLQIPPERIDQGTSAVFSQLNTVGVGWRKHEFRLQNVKKVGKVVQADLNIGIEDFRKGIIDFIRLGITEQERMTGRRPKGLNTDDLLGALARLLDTDFHRLDLSVKQEGDHFSVNINTTAEHIDKSILGYLSLQEVLQPALIEAGTKEHGLSALDKHINAVQTQRFRQALIAAGESQDKGDCDYSFDVSFPKSRFVLKDQFKYHAVVKSYQKAAGLMGVPIMHQDYSLLKVQTTKQGLAGHYFTEVQGPWFDGQWALFTEAAKGMQAFVPSEKVEVQSGKISLDVKKRKVAARGSVQFANLGAAVKQMMQHDTPGLTADPQALQGHYDADKNPGHILWDVYLQGQGADGAKKAIAGAYGAKVKIATEKAVAPPKVEAPKVEMPKTLAAEILADRKTLGVTPWTPPAPTPVATPTARPTPYLKIFAGLFGLMALAGVAVVVMARRRASSGPPSPF